MEELQPFIDEVVPVEKTERDTDFSKDDYMDCLEAYMA